jgi:hypothetical protein
MHRVVLAGLTAALSLSSSFGFAQTPVELKAGDMAPAFSALGSDGKTHTLDSALGGSRLVPESVHRWVNGGMQLAP